MPISIFATVKERAACLYGLIVVTLIAVASPAAASDWQYGCRGVLPSGDAPVIIFSRTSLVMLPKAWVKGPLQASVNERLVSSNFSATEINSGLVANMVFKHDGHPDEKLTLTEISSKTISDVHHPPGRSPRSEQITTYRKKYRWVSDSSYQGPYEITMDCINYELSAPIRR